MNVKRYLILMLLIPAAGFVLSACGSSTPEPAKDAQTIAESNSIGSASVIAEGRIVPRDSANLFFLTGGKVDEVLVSEGDSVTQGSPPCKIG